MSIFEPKAVAIAFCIAWYKQRKQKFLKKVACSLGCSIILNNKSYWQDSNIQLLDFANATAGPSFQILAMLSLIDLGCEACNLS